MGTMVRVAQVRELSPGEGTLVNASGIEPALSDVGGIFHFVELR